MPASGSNMLGPRGQAVGELATEDVGGEIASLLAAEGAGRQEGSVGHGSDGGRYRLRTSLAAKGEVAESGCGWLPGHETSIGE